MGMVGGCVEVLVGLGGVMVMRLLRCVALVQAGIHREHYFGGVLVGNDCNRLVKNFERLRPTFEQFTSPNRRSFSDFCAVCRSLRGVIELAWAGRVVCLHEEGDLNDRCAAVYRLFKETIRHCMPKLHMVARHMPLFAAAHHSIGLATESAIESMHRATNDVLRALRVYKHKPADRLRSLALRLCALTSPAIPRMNPIQRICPDCHQPWAQYVLGGCACEQRQQRRADRAVKNEAKKRKSADS
jgi:hypothetical protein